MIVAVGTENQAKIAAVVEIVALAFPDTQVDIRSHSVTSGVRDQPLTDNETIQGAVNRARTVSEIEPNTDIAIGLEGGVQDTEFGMFLRGWVAVIETKTNRIFYGHSGGMRIPDDIADELRNGEELGPLTQKRNPHIEDTISNTIGTGGDRKSVV